MSKERRQNNNTKIRIKIKGEYFIMIINYERQKKYIKIVMQKSGLKSKENALL